VPAPSAPPRPPAGSRLRPASAGSAILVRVSAAARSRKAAPLTRPPRPRARSSDRSSSAPPACPGQSPPRPVARPPVRIDLRVGDRTHRLVRAMPRWSRSGVVTADRISRWRNRTRGSQDTSRPTPGASHAPGSIPRLPTAFQISAGSPVGSAAASSNSICVPPGRVRTRDRYSSSRRPCTASSASPDRQVRQSRQHHRPFCLLAGGEHHACAVGVQTPGDEPEHLPSIPGPATAHHRSGAAPAAQLPVGQHSQRREADQEPVRRRTVHRPVVSCAGPLVPPSLTPGRAVLQPVQPLTGGPLEGDNMA